MAIKVRCTCGREFKVEDCAAGREAFCPTCRKAVQVPASGEQEKPAALPAGAPGPAAGPRDALPTAPPGAQGGGGGGVEVFPDRIKFHCECGKKVSVKLPPPASAGTCPRCKRILKVPALPDQAAAGKATDAGKKPAPAADKPPDAAGKPAAAALERCTKCGRRIDSPGAAFCPRCGFPLALRKAPAPAPAPASASPQARKPPRNQAPPAVAAPPANAFRVPAPSPDAGKASDKVSDVVGQSAGVARRLAALVLDAAAACGVGLAGAMAAGKLGQDSAGITAALVGGATFAALNNVVFAALAGARSLGMVATGVCVMTCEGRPAGLLLLLARLLASAAFSPGAPLALFDRQHRTLHDIVCGTTVRRTGA